MKNVFDKIPPEEKYEKFDNIPLPEGHLDRFKQRLAKERRKRVFRRILVSSISIAAMLAIAVFLQIDRPAVYSEGTPATQTEEVAYHYNYLLNEKIEEIRAIIYQEGANKHAQLLSDLEEMQENTLNPEQSENLLSQDDQIALIIKNYDARISSLENIESLLLRNLMNN